MPNWKMWSIGDTRHLSECPSVAMELSPDEEVETTLTPSFLQFLQDPGSSVYSTSSLDVTRVMGSAVSSTSSHIAPIERPRPSILQRTLPLTQDPPPRVRFQDQQEQPPQQGLPPSCRFESSTSSSRFEQGSRAEQQSQQAFQQQQQPYTEQRCLGLYSLGGLQPVQTTEIQSTSCFYGYPNGEDYRQTCEAILYPPLPPPAPSHFPPPLQCPPPPPPPPSPPTPPSVSMTQCQTGEQESSSGSLGELAGSFACDDDGSSLPDSDVSGSTEVRRSMPPLSALLRALSAMRPVAPGKHMGVRIKLPYQRQAQACLRWYCNNADIISVLTTYHVMGGTCTSESSYRHVKTYMVREMGVLSMDALSCNQELLFTFLNLFASA